jgi:hypothetical protein
MRKTHLILLSFAVLCTLTAFCLPAVAADCVPIGVADIDTTPDKPVKMYGYGSRKTEFEGIAGRLNATALAIGTDEGDGPAVILSVDIGAVHKDMRNAVLKRLQAKVNLKSERFMLCNTHNHSGPNVKGMPTMPEDERGHLPEYARTLAEKLEKVVMDALAARSPGSLSWTQGTVKFAANRRLLTDGKWSGFGAVHDAPADHALPVLRVTNPDGRVRAVLVNYACHCTTLRGNFMEIHPDWAGSAREYIEADNPGVTALISIGYGSDSDPYPHGTVELCQKHGREMADEVNRLLKGPWTPITPTPVARTATIELPRVDPPTESPADQSNAKPSGPLTYTVATWVFGDDLAMVFLEGEVVVDYGTRMRRELDARRLWMTAYTNDVPCYIASKRIITEGGYEAKNSLSAKATGGHPEKLAPLMEDRIVGQVKALLPEGFLAK